MEISKSVFFYRSLLFLKMKFRSIGLWLQYQTPQNQFPGTRDIFDLREAVKTVFFHKII